MPDLGPDRREELRLALEGGVVPYIRRTADGQLLVSVAEPARRSWSTTRARPAGTYQ